GKDTNHLPAGGKGVRRSAADSFRACTLLASLLETPCPLPRAGRGRSLWANPRFLSGKVSMNPQQASGPARPSYAWARRGDVIAFFGLMLDNVAVLILLFSLLTSAHLSADRRFTPEFVLIHMVPGTALGVLLGDLVYTWMAF